MDPENNKKIEETLESIGFQKSEISIYIELVKAGKLSAQEVSNRTKIHRPNVYDILSKLVKKGVVTENTKDNKKIFYPIKPKNLLGHLKQRERNLREIIPHLESIQSSPFEERKVVTSEGASSIRRILNNFLETGESMLSYGAPKESADRLGFGFMNDFHKRRIKKKIPMRHIYNRDAIKRIKYMNQLEHTEARYLPSSFNTNVNTFICGNRVVLILWDEPMFAITIENNQIAESYKKYFEIIWEEAKITFE